MTLDKPQAMQMLRTMVLIREFDERAIALRVAGKIYGAVHPYVGQEAVAAGVCASLTTRDRVTSNHRGHGHCIAKGADIRRMMAELFGRVDGYCKGKGGSMHIADFAVGMLGANGIVGGAAHRVRRRARRPARRQGRRDGVLLRRRRGWPRASSTRRSISRRCGSCPSSSSARTTSTRRTTPSACSIPGSTSPRMPAPTAFRASSPTATTCSRSARRPTRPWPRAARRGPSLVECKTYRWHFHAMRAAPPPESRPADEIASWKARDPIARFEAHALGQGLLSPAEIGAMRERVAADLAARRRLRRGEPVPRSEGSAGRHVRGVRGGDHARDQLPEGARRGGGRGDAARRAGHHPRHRLHRRPRQGVRPGARALHAHLRGGGDGHGPGRGRLRLSAPS